MIKGENLIDISRGEALILFLSKSSFNAKRTVLLIYSKVILDIIFTFFPYAGFFKV